jgi:predicted PurR-regulated permease PerM
MEPTSDKADRDPIPRGNDRTAKLWMFVGATLFVAILYWGQAVLIPIALAMLMTFLLAPLVSRLQRWGIKRGVSVSIVVVLTIVLLGGTLLLALIQLRNLAEELPHYRANIRQKIGDLRKFQKDQALEQFKDVIGEVRGELSKDDNSPQPPPSAAAEPAYGVAGQPFFWESLKQPLASAGLVLLLLIYMLAQREELRNRLIGVFGYSNLTITTHALEEIGQRITQYLLTQLAINSSFGVLIAIALAVIDLPYAFLWGFLATLLIFVPVIGFWVAAALPTVLSLAVFTSWVYPLFVLGLFLALKTVINIILEPMLYGKSAGVLQVPLLILLAFWTWLWGPIGLILATPLTVSLLVFAKHVPGLEFLNLLMSDQPAMEPRISFYQRLLAQDYDEALAILLEYLKDHPAENAYDDLLLPALSYTKADRRRGQLTLRQEEFVFASVPALQEELEVDARDSPTASEPQIHIVGCAAGGAADSLSLACLFHLVDRQRFHCEILSDAVLASEAITWVAARAPAAVVIAVLPPGSLARSRYLCKRLRAAFAQLKIFVLYWRRPGDQRHEAQSFLAAGADSVSSTVLEARAQIGNLAVVVAMPTNAKIGA